MDSDAIKNVRRQYAQKTTFRDKFKVVWDYTAPHNDMNAGKTEKTVGHSMICREIGNKEYTAASHHDYLRKSIEAYTESIAFAPVGSSELSLAYANRSAVLFKARLYKDCLLDIERSLKAGYPDRLKTKLFLRQSLCLKALKPNSGLEPGISMANAIQWLPDLKKYNPKYNIIKEYPKMINELKEPREIIKFIPEIKNDNTIIVGASDAIELKKTNENNQHVVATRDIKSGEFIYISEPFALTVSYESRFTNCWHCCRSTWAGVPCDNCPTIIYCSDTCKKKAWDSYHNIECLVLGSLLKPDALTTEFILPVKLFFKTLNLAGSLVELKNKVDDIDSMTNQGSILTNGILDVNTFDNFHLLDYFKATSNNCSFELAFFVVALVPILCQKTDILGKKLTAKYLIDNKNEKLLILGELLLRYMMIVNRSGQLMMKKEPGSSVVLSNTMLPFLKIIKPSCDPNVNWTYVGSNVGYYAVKPIKRGQPILGSATGSYHMTSKFDRHLRLGLTSTDHIQCKCKACVEDWPTMEHLPSYKRIALILPTRIQRELNCMTLKLEEWLNLIDQGDPKKLFTIKDELSSMNDMIHQYITVPCKEISQLYLLLKTVYDRLHSVHDIYE